MIADPKQFPRKGSAAVPRLQPLAGYNIGYIGFTHVPGFLADGICYFERWSKLSDVSVTHAFVVTGVNECAEAHWLHGVQAASLGKYLKDPNTVTVFRRPRGWSMELGNRISASARSRIGSRYNIGLIAAQCMANTFVGHYLNKWFSGRPDAWMSARLDRKNEFICSELAAFAMNEQPEFRSRGILSSPLDTISPQELFEDQVIFEPREEIERA
jgi:hypothetical protein